MKYLIFFLFGITVFGGVWLLSPAKQPIDEQEIAPTAAIHGHGLKLEIVRTPEEMAQGLSGKQSLEENAGMLFVYETSVVPGFWMKDMNFPIDIIWIGSDKRIVDISENIAPETFPQLFYPRSSVQYVLEVNANWASNHNIFVDDIVELRIDK